METDDRRNRTEKYQNIGRPLLVDGKISVRFDFFNEKPRNVDRINDSLPFWVDSSSVNIETDFEFGQIEICATLD